jgi:arginase family enzyme
LGVIGAPYNRSVTPGRYDLGPDAIRQALHRYSTFDFEDGRDLATMAVRDFGNVPVSEGDAVWSAESMAAGFQPPVTCILGGDNGVTRAGVRALADREDIGFDQIGLITLDAHLDMRDLDHGAMNGNPVRGLLEDGLPATNIHQIGLQSFANSAPYVADAQARGLRLTPVAELFGDSFIGAVRQALGELAANTLAIYVDIDLDVMDMAFAPACPGARPGGISPRQLRKAARVCGAHPKVRCVDIVELDGERDINDQTALAAAAVFLEFAAGVVERG